MPIVTISASSLTREHLIAAGADPDTPVVGTDAGREFTRAILGDEERLDAALAERDILDAGDMLLEQHPETGAVLLECTNMVPYARALSEHLRLPVFSIYTFVAWFQAGLVPRGHILLGTLKSPPVPSSSAPSAPSTLPG